MIVSRCLAFVAENIEGRIDIISKDYEVLGNVQIIGNRVFSFKNYVAVGVKNDEQFHISVVSTYVARVLSITNDMRKKH